VEAVDQYNDSLDNVPGGTQLGGRGRGCFTTDAKGRRTGPPERIELTDGSKDMLRLGYQNRGICPERLHAACNAEGVEAPAARASAQGGARPVAAPRQTSLRVRGEAPEPVGNDPFNLRFARVERTRAGWRWEGLNVVPVGTKGMGVVTTTRQAPGLLIPYLGVRVPALSARRADYLSSYVYDMKDDDFHPGVPLQWSVDADPSKCVAGRCIAGRVNEPTGVERVNVLAVMLNAEQMQGIFDGGCIDPPVPERYGEPPVVGGCIFFVTMTTLPAGHELLVDYGDGFEDYPGRLPVRRQAFFWKNAVARLNTWMGVKPAPQTPLRPDFVDGDFAEGVSDLPSGAVVLKYDLYGCHLLNDCLARRLDWLADPASAAKARLLQEAQRWDLEMHERLPEWTRYQPRRSEYYDDTHTVLLTDPTPAPGERCPAPAPWLSIAPAFVAAALRITSDQEVGPLLDVRPPATVVVTGYLPTDDLSDFDGIPLGRPGRVKFIGPAAARNAWRLAAPVGAPGCGARALFISSSGSPRAPHAFCVVSFDWKGGDTYGAYIDVLCGHGGKAGELLDYITGSLRSCPRRVDITLSSTNAYASAEEDETCGPDKAPYNWSLNEYYREHSFVNATECGAPGQYRHTTESTMAYCPR
jgi:hypothetical protein